MVFCSENTFESHLPTKNIILVYCPNSDAVGLESFSFDTNLANFNSNWYFPLSLPAFACQPALKSSLKNCFSDFFPDFKQNITGKCLEKQKRLNMAKKSILTSFQVHTAPKNIQQVALHCSKQI